MLKEAKKVPAIRFRGFTDDWEQHKLGDVCQITMGQSPDGATYSEEPSDYILIQGNADLQNGWVTPRVWTTQKTKMADAGDLIMSVRAPAGAMGKTAYKAVIGRGVAAIKGNEFIYQTLIKMDSNSYWKRLAAGSTFESINSDTIFNAEIMLPSELEQTKIGKIFDSIDNLITLHQRKLDQQKKLKKYFLQNMFPGKGEKVPRIRFKGFTGDWEQRKLGELARFSKGLGYSKSDLQPFGTPIILYGRLYTKYETIIKDIDTFVNANDGAVYSQGGEVIVPASGETAEDISIASVVEKSGIILGGDLNIIHPNDNLDSTFLAISVSNGEPHRDMARRAQGKSVVHLHNDDLSQIKLRYPSLAEQHKISQYLCNIENLISSNQHKINQLQTLKKYMLQNMFI